MNNEKWFIVHIDKFGDIKKQTNAYDSEENALEGLEYLDKKGEAEGRFVWKDS